MKYRLQFTKQDKMQYIGHLDLLKVFQRSIKRAKLPIAYSQGFNPHQQMSFAIPLPLGATSDSEFIDIALTNEVEPDAIRQALNDQLPDGVCIRVARKLQDNEKNGAAALIAATYDITLNEPIENIQATLETMLACEEMPFEKTSKNKTKTINIRPMIYELQSIGTDDSVVLRATIATGSMENLKPDHLVAYLYNILGLPFLHYKIRYNRIDMLQADKDGKRKQL